MRGNVKFKPGQPSFSSFRDRPAPASLTNVDKRQKARMLWERAKLKQRVGGISLLSGLEKETDLQTRSYLIEAAHLLVLSDHRTREILPKLVVFMDSADINERYFAVSALAHCAEGYVDIRQYAGSLVERLHDIAPKVRMAASRALTSFGSHKKENAAHVLSLLPKDERTCEIDNVRRALRYSSIPPPASPATHESPPANEVPKPSVREERESLKLLVTSLSSINPAKASKAEEELNAYAEKGPEHAHRLIGVIVLCHASGDAVAALRKKCVAVMKTEKPVFQTPVIRRVKDE